jgi:RNA polymerase sigma factor (sigma-70 family)
MSESESPKKRILKRNDDASETDIRQRLIDGDSSSWEDLNKAHAQKIMSSLSLIDRRLAEDAWQETLQKLTKNPSILPAEANDEGLHRWLFTVTRNNLFDLKRKVQKHREVRSLDEHAKQYVQKTQASLVEKAILLEGADRVRNAMNQLDEKYRLVIYRHYFQGEYLAKIGRDIDVPSGTIRTWHSRAIAQLREILSGGDDD